MCAMPRTQREASTYIAESQRLEQYNDRQSQTYLTPLTPAPLPHQHPTDSPSSPYSSFSASTVSSALRAPPHLPPSQHHHSTAPSRPKHSPPSRASIHACWAVCPGSRMLCAVAELATRRYPLVAGNLGILMCWKMPMWSGLVYAGFEEMAGWVNVVRPAAVLAILRDVAGGDSQPSPARSPPSSRPRRSPRKSRSVPRRDSSIPNRTISFACSSERSAL